MVPDWTTNSHDSNPWLSMVAPFVAALPVIAAAGLIDRATP
jgi:hypothetical protein